MFLNTDGYPRACDTCGQVTYANPTPVAVTLLPANDGLVVVRRNIEPKKGQLALPGGFMNLGETWQKACSRELEEETGLIAHPDDIQLFDVVSVPNGNLLVFGFAPKITNLNLSTLKHDHEVSEVAVIREDFVELAFPTHTQMAREWFRIASWPI